MTSLKKIMALAAVGLVASAVMASAAIVTAGTNAFDGGYASLIRYDDAAQRGTDNDRDNPLNALGAANGNFFEIGTGSTVELTFGTRFTSPGTIIEITFGSRTGFPESASVFVGLGSNNASFVEINESPITNTNALINFTFSGGPFDTLRITDTSSQSPGGFDIDSVRVAPIPLPAAGLLLLGGLGALGLFSRRKEVARA